MNMFDALGFLSLYSVFLAVFFILFRRTGLSLLYPSILMAMFWMYLVCAYLGLPLLYFELVVRLKDVGISDKSIIWTMLICSGVCLCLLLVGYIFAQEALNLRPVSRRMEIIPDTQLSMLVPVVLMVVSILVYLAYLAKTDMLPLIGVLKGFSTQTVTRARIDGTRFFSGKYHWYSLWFSNILPFVSYYFLMMCMIARKRRWPLGCFVASFSISAFALLGNLEKYPFLMYLEGLLFVYLIWRNRTISRKMMLVGLPSLAVFLFLTLTFFMGVDSEDSPFASIYLGFARIFVGQLVPLYVYFDLVPDQIGYLWGQTFPNPLNILPYTPFDFSHEAMAYFESRYLGIGTYGGNMPTVFWGEVYVNFGMGLACLSAFCIGGFLCMIHFLISKGYGTPLRVVFMAWMIVHFQQLAMTGASFLLTDIYFFGVFLSAIAIRKWQKRVIPHILRGNLT